MAPNRAQGSSANPQPTTAQRIAQAQRDGDTRTAMRLKAAQALGNN
jgi:lipase chaperone LimK